MNNERFIGLLEMKLIGMISAHRLITEFDNSSVDHYQREVDMLKNRISLLKAENEIDASDAPDVKHDAYADVRNLECEADSTDTVAHTSSAALETRIDSEIGCVYCSGSGVIPVWTEHGMNSMDCYFQTTKKES